MQRLHFEPDCINNIQNTALDLEVQTCSSQRVGKIVEGNVVSVHTLKEWDTKPNINMCTNYKSAQQTPLTKGSTVSVKKSEAPQLNDVVLGLGFASQSVRNLQCREEVSLKELTLTSSPNTFKDIDQSQLYCNARPSGSGYFFLQNSNNEKTGEWLSSRKNLLIAMYHYIWE